MSADREIKEALETLTDQLNKAKDSVRIYPVELDMFSTLAHICVLQQREIVRLTQAINRMTDDDHR